MNVLVKDGKLQSNRIPGLDGWRGISIILVIMGHQIVDGASFIDTSRYSSFFKFLTWHLYGVQVFFVISGFLITRLLDMELQITKTINLRNFYLRRVFRILPAYYLLLITTFILSRFNHNGEILNGNVWIKSLFFISNYDFGGTSWTLGHTWSLSVEEQFYLIWPIVFYYPKWRKVIPVIFICAAPIFRMINYRYKLFSDFAFWVHCDSIFIGAFFATLKNKEWVNKYKFLLVGISLTLLFCEKEIIPYSGFITIPFSRTFFSLAIISLIFYSFDPKVLLLLMK